jgi:hypothetical protein
LAAGSGKYFAVSFPKYSVNIVRSINTPDEYSDLMMQIAPGKISLSQKIEDKAFHINGMGLFSLAIFWTRFYRSK